MSKLSLLKHELAVVKDLQSASWILDWDQATYMPEGGATARGRQIATLQSLSHETLISDKVAKLLDQAAAEVASLADSHPDKALVRVGRRDHDRAKKIPPAFTAKLADHLSLSYNTWAKARPENDFARVLPLLEKTVELSREMAGFLGGGEHIADPLIDGSDEGMTVKSVRALFDSLRAELVPLVAAIAKQQQVDDSCLRGKFPESDQLAFGEKVIRKMGYDFNRGRQDKTHHPFMTRFSGGDVRITTRVNEADIGDAFFSTVHEAGHALYEQGINAALDGTILGDGVSAGVHESQSRLWENLVARSLPFWAHFYGELQQSFPSLKSTKLSDFYRAINKVERSLIRVDADEVTYNLHVMIRFDLELALLEGKLAVRDLPDAWRARYQSDLGVSSPTDKDGCMQDVHWYAMQLGGNFQGYTLGNVLAAQFYEAALVANPQIPGDVERGEFSALKSWLNQHVHHDGRIVQPAALVERATGKPMTIAPYIQYLRRKYSDIYAL